VVETETPPAQDASGEALLYDEYMTRVYIADAMPEERSALRLLLMDLNMEVVGEAADWTTAIAETPSLHTDMLLIDWSILPRTMQGTALEGLRQACPAVVTIVLISHLDARQQAALSSGADTFISKSETPDRVAERLRSVADSIRTE
jgi:DNA-binding NarL/FixJ family response regulator